MKKRKSKLLVSVVAVMLCMAAFSMTAFASGDDWCEYGDYDTPSTTTVQTPASTSTPEAAATPEVTTTPDAASTSVTEASASNTTTENSAAENTTSESDTAVSKVTSGTTLTPSGNLTLVDDLVQTSASSEDETDATSTSGNAAQLDEKQFITVQSKNGNYFYLIIDRSGDEENVHFLNQVDESDLLSLIEDEDTDTTPAVCVCTDKCVVGDINTACPVCQTTMSECVGKEQEPESSQQPDTEPEEQETKSGNSGVLVIVLVLALAGGGAVYFLKFKKEKPDTKGPVDLDDYDFGDDDEDDSDEDYEFEQDDDEPEERNEGD